jgi:hypothetical protein
LHAAAGSFYDSLPVLEEFLKITDPSSYAPVPDDWLIAETDVQGSTEAINRGKYKDVNVAGAASIISLLNIDRNLGIPFIFGGDGATLCIPPAWEERAKSRLIGTVRMAREAFGLSLRAGLIPVHVVRTGGFDVRVARHRISAGYVQAVFTGGGIEYAESMIKTPEGARFALAEGDADPEQDFSGLECRWNDVPSVHGEVVSLIVKVLATDPAESTRQYRDLILTLRRIYGSDTDCRPIHPSKLKMSLLGPNPSRERRVRTSGQSAASRLACALAIRGKVITGNVLIGLKRKTRTTDWGDYPARLAENTDFRKFSDIFRQVLSGTPAQRQELDDYLEGLYGKGALVYGMHVSPTALLTCMIFSYNGVHMHLVDGGNGGYALAAAAMKERIRRMRASPGTAVSRTLR